jgi:hypothetical protein
MVVFESWYIYIYIFVWLKVYSIFFCFEVIVFREFGHLGSCYKSRHLLVSYFLVYFLWLRFLHTF